ncbi:MAG: hypothetical protein LBC83_04670 [Oscillospiraceae bacterium]|jgi:hypothetical protein|nr:hypothetical protein [Oscillospiraceae bacterium]
MAEKAEQSKTVGEEGGAVVPFMQYKGHPLVRCGDTLYYGSLAEPYVVMLKIDSTKDVNGLAVADKVYVTLMNTDPEASLMDQIINRCDRRGLYDAIDIAHIWLERQLKKTA